MNADFQKAASNLMLRETGILKKSLEEGFPGGPIINSLPCNAGDTSWIPGPETPQAAGPLSLRAATTETCKPESPGSKTREDTAMRSPGPQQRPRAAKNKFKKKKKYIYIYILQNFLRETRIRKDLLQDYFIENLTCPLQGPGRMCFCTAT